ncbi:MAG TPA: DNA polymerase III subunit delta', partial [Rhodobacteraceae bacterium]|nr:DNA polymerase III subunit delta' [Paracoccaceae bacterium]
KARAWADAAQRISARVSHGRAVNVDSAQLMLDALLTMQATAAA